MFVSPREPTVTVTNEVPPVDKVLERGEQNRRMHAERSRKEYTAVREIGKLPEIKDPDRRRACTQSFKLFCEVYHKNTFTLGWSEDHLLVISQIEEAVFRGGTFCTAMPRGGGKTALFEAASEFGLLCGHQLFTVLISSDAPSAIVMLRSIKTDLETNDELAEDFPEIVYPIRALEGVQARTRGQTYNGERTRIDWGPRYVVLPTIKPQWVDIEKYADFLRPDGYSCSSGLVLRAAGLTGSIRGMKHKLVDGSSIRPTFIIIDDPQSDSSARSPTQVEKRTRILSGAVLGLGGPGQKIAAVMAVTVIQRDDVADRLLDRSRNPSWQGIRTKILYDWPRNMALWEEYKNIRVEDQQLEAGVTRCNQFLYDHWYEMHEGARVAWEDRKNFDELSALQHCMNLLYDRGESSFYSEYMNEPLSELDDNPEDLTPDQVMSKVNRHARFVVPQNVEHLTCGIDVQKNLLYFVTCGFEKNFTGHVLNYGTFPDQKNLYFNLAQAKKTIAHVIPAPDFEGRLYGALDALITNLLTQEFTRDDGTIFKIEKMLIDSNWSESTNTIFKFIRQSPFSGLILPSFGKYVGASSKPMVEWQKRQGDRAGQNWKIRSLEGRKSVRSVLFDSNAWKSFLHARLAVPAGSKGGISFYGEKPEIHRMIATQLTRSEYRVRVEAKGSGRSVDEWRARPERVVDGHYFDAMILSCVAASIQGVKVEESGKRVVDEKRKVSFKGLQEKKLAPAVRSNRVSFKELQQKNQNPPPR